MAADPNLPNAILAGAQKAGTSALFRWLGRHQEIWAPEEAKELHFFCDDRLYSKGPRLLKRTFAGGETTPVRLLGGVNHLYFADKAAPRLRDFNPGMKILVVLRDPVERAYSAYNYFAALGREDLEFDAALDREMERRERGGYRTLSDLTYVDHGLYSRQLQVYLELFPRESIQVTLHDDLRTAEARRSILGFLDVDMDFDSVFESVNPTARPRFRTLNRLLFGTGAATVFLYRTFLFHHLMSRRTKDRILGAVRQLNALDHAIPPIPEPTRRRLEQSFADEVDHLESLLGVDLSRWRRPSRAENLRSGTSRD